MRRTITLVLAIVLAALLGGAGAAVANSYMTSAVAGNDVIVSGAVIRFSDPNGYPSLHCNGAHLCAGVESVGISPYGGVEVTQSVTGAVDNPIISFQATGDETISGRRGIIVGVSGGTDKTTIELYDTKLNRPLNMNVKADRMRVQGKNANLWVYAVHAPVH